MALTLDLLRHGEAEPAGRGGDDARPLTAVGRADLGRLARALADRGARHERVFASPLARAQESAAIVSGTARPPAGIETLEALCPECEPGEVLEALAALGVEEGAVLLVAHQPLLGRLAGQLTGREIPFAPASLVRLHCVREGRNWIGQLRWAWQAAAHRP